MTDTSIQPGDLRSLWQSMPATPITITAEDMRARALAFERTVRRRNFGEYAAAMSVIGVCGWYATFPEPATPLWPIANLMIIAGVLLIIWNLNRLARTATPPASASTTDLIHFQRSQYTRQRDALKSVWLWYILPVIPGEILWFVAYAVGTPTESPVRSAVVLGGAALITSLVFGVVVLLNFLGAARLQRLIDDLDRFKDR